MKFITQNNKDKKLNIANFFLKLKYLNDEGCFMANRFKK